MKLNPREFQSVVLVIESISERTALTTGGSGASGYADTVAAIQFPAKKIQASSNDRNKRQTSSAFRSATASSSSTKKRSAFRNGVRGIDGQHQSFCRHKDACCQALPQCVLTRPKGKLRNTPVDVIGAVERLGANSRRSVSQSSLTRRFTNVSLIDRIEFHSPCSASQIKQCDAILVDELGNHLLSCEAIVPLYPKLKSVIDRDAEFGYDQSSLAQPRLFQGIETQDGKET